MALATYSNKEPGKEERPEELLIHVHFINSKLSGATRSRLLGDNYSVRIATITLACL